MLPDSYKFPRNTPREQVIQRMQQAQRRAVQEIWERRLPDVPLRTPEQLITMASIVEKETGKTEERTRVAAVFANRLKQKMRLQSDPTDHLRNGRRQGDAGAPAVTRRYRPADALQHLCDRRAAAGTDRQSGARLAGSRGQSGADKGTVFRGRRHRRA